MNFRDAADDIVSPKEIMRTRGEQFCVDAVQEGMKKCEEWNVEINRRMRKKNMLGEMEANAGLTAQEETKRVTKSTLHTVVAGLDARFQSACKVSSCKKFTFAISSPDEFLYHNAQSVKTSASGEASAPCTPAGAQPQILTSSPPSLSGSGTDASDAMCMYSHWLVACIV